MFAILQKQYEAAFLSLNRPEDFQIPKTTFINR